MIKRIQGQGKAREFYFKLAKVEIINFNLACLTRLNAGGNFWDMISATFFLNKEQKFVENLSKSL